MDADNDLTLHAWFAGEDDPLWIAHNPHLQYKRSRSIAGSSIQHKMFDDKDYISIVPTFFHTDVQHYRIFGNPEIKQEAWDNACIDTYHRVFKDSNYYIRTFGRAYEIEAELECHRCGEELYIFNQSFGFQGLCDTCDEQMTDDSYPL